MRFLSTPSARRATPAGWADCPFSTISIHALREEGDNEKPVALPNEPDFYPRPPRGGRPRFGRCCRCGLSISIHALREEGDESDEMEIRFYSSSIHALREEGDFFIPNRLLWKH